MHKFRLLALLLLLPALAFGGTVTGVVQTATSGPVINGTLTFTLTQSAVQAGTATIVTSPVSCYTDASGNVVGEPNPLVAPVVTPNTASGTLAAGTYFTVIALGDASGTTFYSPETTTILSAPGSLIVSAPVRQPVGATSYKVFISSATGTETLQSAVTVSPGSWPNYTQSASLSAGSALPASNSTACKILFNDQLTPSFTGYNVSMTNQGGSALSGFPQKWYLSGGASGTVNLSSGTPLYSGVVTYPQAIVTTPASQGRQSVSGALDYGVAGQTSTNSGNQAVTGNFSVGGTSTLSSVNNTYSFNGTELGAKCDGVTDDSAAWTAAMTKASTLGGLKIIFPIGKTCFFAAGISVTQPNVALDCAGGFSSTFHNAGAATPTCELLFAAGNNITGIDTTATVGNISSSVTIKHLYIKGQASGTGTGNGIHLTSNAPWLEQNVIEGFGNCGVSVDSSGTNANVNFFHLVQNYSKSNKGDGYCFNGLTNGNANVGVIEQNTAYNNGGWGFDLLSGGTFKPSANLFITNHCVSNTSGCFNVNGTGNTFIGNYTEVSSSGMTLNAGSAANYIVNGAFGGMQITDNGVLNTVISMNCGVTLGTVNSAPCQSNQVNIGPVPGSASTKVFSWATGRQSTDSFDLSDIVNGKLYINFTSGTTPIWFFENAVNLWLAEGTCAGANAGVSELCAEAATHRFELSNNGVARSPIAVFSDNIGNFASGGTATPALYASSTNCASSAGTCAAAPAGRVSIAAAATTVTVATTAVTANSEIFIQEDATLGAALSVTCNTTTGRTYTVTTRTAGTSFVITSSAAPVTNPACLSYHIMN